MCEFTVLPLVLNVWWWHHFLRMDICSCRIRCTLRMVWWRLVWKRLRILKLPLVGSDDCRCCRCCYHNTALSRPSRSSSYVRPTSTTECHNCDGNANNDNSTCNNNSNDRTRERYFVKVTIRYIYTCVCIRVTAFIMSTVTVKFTKHSNTA